MNLIDGMKSRKLLAAVKVLLCAFVAAWVAKCLFVRGFEDSYDHLTLGSGMQIAFTIFFVTVLCMALCYAIWNFETLYTCFANSDRKQGILYACYFSFYMALLYNPLESSGAAVTKFQRVIGTGLNRGIDVSRRISNFSRWFVYFGVVFILFYLLMNYLKNQKLDGENAKAAALLDQVIIVANVVMVFRCISYFYDESQKLTMFYYSDFLILGILCLGFAYIALELEKKICVENFEALHVIGWMGVFPISIVVTHEWNQGRNFMGFQLLASLAIVFVVKLCAVDWNEKRITKTMGSLAGMISFLPFCTSLYIEALVWLNQRSIFVTHLRKYYVLSVLLGLFFAMLIACLLGNREKGLRNWKRVSYPAIIFGMTCIWKQIPISQTYGVDLFESANSSVLISDFLNFGNIPIVEHYGGHMMSGVWEGILYAFLNNDVAGAAFSPYSGYVAVAVVLAFYCFLKNVWNEDAAILAVLFFPFYGSISYWGLGLLTALAAMHYVRKNTCLRAAIFWMACIWCALYRLDTGYAFLLACMAALLIYMVAEKNFTAAKQLGLTLCAWGVLGLAVWTGICVIKGISPIDRLLEFLQINLSNQNWAYSGIGDASLTKFSVAYIFVPLILVVLLIFTVIKKNIRQFLGTEQWVLLLVLGLSYFFNFSRGLVRHSLAENTLSFVWTAYAFIALFAVAYYKNKKLLLPVFAGCMLLQTLLYSGTIFSENSIANAAMSNLGNFTETWTAAKNNDGKPQEKTYWVRLSENQEVVERVKWGNDCCGQPLQKTIGDYRVLIDELLEPEETFVDFINKTSIYPLLGRRDPVYVSQSPLQLSGEFTQEQFVKEMEGIPIVLMPYSWSNLRASQTLDDVPNLYRYYKVAEYIYQNYVPLCTYEELYAVWCLPERYEQMASRVSAMSENEIEYKNIFVSGGALEFASVEAVENTDGSVDLNYTQKDPMVMELQREIEMSSYIDKNITITIDYETDILGSMQIFYTTEAGEGYSGSKGVTVELTETEGTACFKLPVTEHTRLRFDTPEGSHVKIKSFRISEMAGKLAVYGYDGPFLQEDGESISYMSAIHTYGLNQLPLIWAETDTKKSAENPVITELTGQDGVFRYSLEPGTYGENGNYLKLTLEYDAGDTSGNTKTEEVSTGATLLLGKMVDGSFETRYQYSFTVFEGQHDYMFRVSNDYYWYVGELDAVKLECDGQLKHTQMRILEGD